MLYAGIQLNNDDMLLSLSPLRPKLNPGRKNLLKNAKLYWSYIKKVSQNRKLLKSFLTTLTKINTGQRQMKGKLNFSIVTAIS